MFQGLELIGDVTTFVSDLAGRAAGYAGVLSWVETATAIGAAYATRMIPLRVMAILNNLIGVILGAAGASPQTFIEHAVNLPLNLRRLREMRRLIASVRLSNETDLNIEWLKPFMHPRAMKAGGVIFSQGDAANEAFLLTEGSIEIPERSVVLAPGTLFGEMAFFTATGARTASAVCASDVRLLVISYDEFEQLYFQNPQFGLYLVRLIVRRFEMNHAHAQEIDPAALRAPKSEVRPATAPN